MKVVCFDLGGVLVEINHHWKGALLDAGLPESLAQRFDVPLVELEPFNDYQKGRLTFDEYLETLVDYFGGIDIAKAREIHNAILRSAYPGIPELIAEVHGQGLSTGVLSNTNQPHWEAMHEAPRLAVLQTIHHPIASHLIGAEKPDPRMYHAFEAASGARPEEILYFDDSFANVEAARELGWDAHRIDPLGDTAAEVRQKIVEKGWL